MTAALECVKGQVRGSSTDRYLSDYPNMYGDLSAGSGLNALKRDEEHAREFSPTAPGQTDLRQ